MSTETATNRFAGEGTLVSALVIGLFLATLAVPRILGSGGAVRLKLLVEALIFVGLLAGLGVLVVARGQIRLHREYETLWLLFIGFLFLALIGLVNGFLRAYAASYIIGDYYKFAIPILTIFGIYAAAESTDMLHRVFEWVVGIYLLFILGALTLYLTGGLNVNQRPGFIYYLPIVLVLSYWLFRNGDPIGKLGFPVLALTVVPLVYFSQSLSLLLQTGLIVVFSIIYFHTEDVSDLIPIGLGLGLIGTFLAITFYLLATQVPASQWDQYGYLGSKVVAFVGDYTLYERLILLGGSRLAEPFGVFDSIDGSVLELVFGIGLGSTFEVSSPFPWSVWVGGDHFVHSGLWEAILRTGLIGGVIYLGIVLWYLYVGFKIRRDSYLGALVAADATVTLLFLPIGGKLLGTQFFPFVLFAYALVRWSELRNPSPHANEF